MMELTEVIIRMDAPTLAAVEQGLQVLAIHANTALASIRAQANEQIAAAAALNDEKPPAKPNGHMPVS